MTSVVTGESPQTPPAAGIEDVQETKGLSQGQIIRKRFFGHSAAMVALVVFALVVLLVFSASGIKLWGWIDIPGWWKYSYTDVQDIQNNAAPTYQFPFNFGDHPFGQDSIGRDMFAMTMRAAQLSIIVMFTIGIIAGLIGVVVGALSGYFRGWVETVLMRLTDAIIIIPVIVTGAVLGQVVRSASLGTTEIGPDGQPVTTRDFMSNVFKALQDNLGVVLLGIFLALVIWVGLARLVRGEFLTLREREFVDAARIAGASNTRIVFKHILPNAVGVIIVNTTLLMSSAILLEAGLSYIGLGVTKPDISLGSLVVENQEAFSTRPWLFWFPGLFIIVICLCINFIGDGLRDAFDPRQKKFNAKKASSANAEKA
ncbi:ABC transporter permease [Arthrobacter russicus]|uniref:Oligopeptide transport system permease protein OppC n=1 Tax=Arthrobacter russicus TaxID=172040 RepID=A0ABU1J8L9_9MICC|nr:ABC transporter permease [Arthrobacter russicus]MDR6268770.1 peptide/nickel transport system permease protein [Arthrobacter russicus]